MLTAPRSRWGTPPHLPGLIEAGCIIEPLSDLSFPIFQRRSKELRGARAANFFTSYTEDSPGRRHDPHLQSFVDGGLPNLFGDRMKVLVEKMLMLKYRHGWSFLP
jgi:hypothetical protein